MTFLFFLLLSSQPAAAQDCVNIVPGKSLGILTIGQVPPAEKVGSHAIQREKSSPEWSKAGPYLFHVGKGGKIDSIQYEPIGSDTCYSLKGKRLPDHSNLKALRKNFPNCVEEEGNFGPNWVLSCDGLTLISRPSTKPAGGAALQVTVRNQTLRQREEERAGDHVKSILQNEWPYRADKKRTP